MEIIIEKPNNGIIKIKGILNGKEIKWGGKLSKALTDINFVNSDGICELGTTPLKFTVIKDGIEIKCILPPLSVFQTDEEFVRNFTERIRIMKESVEKVTNYPDKRVVSVDLENI